MNEVSRRDTDDISTIRSVMEGDRNAFRILLEKYQPAVSAIGRRIVGVSEDLKDFVQEVFLKAFTHLGQFSGTGRFYSWLMQIAYTTAINQNRRAVPEVPVDPDYLARFWCASRDREPDRAAERAEAADSIFSVVRNLPENLAILVELFFVLGLRYRDIAEITGQPINTLKSRVFRARKLLQEQLDRTLLES